MPLSDPVQIVNDLQTNTTRLISANVPYQHCHCWSIHDNVVKQKPNVLNVKQVCEFTNHVNDRGSYSDWGISIEVCHTLLESGFFKLSILSCAVDILVIFM